MSTELPKTDPKLTVAGSPPQTVGMASSPQPSPPKEEREKTSGASPAQGSDPKKIVPEKAATSTPAALPPAPAPTPLPNPLTHVPVGSEGVPFTARGYHVVASVRPDQVVFAAEQLDKEGFAIDTITGVDWLAESQMEIIYDYFHPVSGLRAAVRARVPRDNPEVPTISGVFPGANWHEREAHDFFGIHFVWHPNLTPFLLPEDATYHPLRKDFTS